MLRIGAHLSIAGGVSKAVERAVIHGCEAPQIFSKNGIQGRTLAYRFEHLAAAGYDLVSGEGSQATFTEFDRLVGLDRVKVFHGNDSKKPCGSRVDRHEHIGDGHLGLEPFRRLLHDTRFAGLTILIETAKSRGSERPGAIVEDPLDVGNLKTLRRLRDA